MPTLAQRVMETAGLDGETSASKLTWYCVVNLPWVFPLFVPIREALRFLCYLHLSVGT